jgi:uncharacterized metal-binding protein YceD (DUF177 family)
MKDDFKIYIDRLREGREEVIDITVSATFIGVPEEFSEPVRVRGVAYLAESHLILRLDIQTKSYSMCTMCNEPVHSSLEIKDFYQTVDLAKIPHSVFNFEDLVRDTILLQAPHIVECSGGQCPHREQLKKYFKNTHV